MPIRNTVIFDCDGVLVDSEPLSLEAFVRALIDQNIQYPRDELTKFCGRSSSESMQIVIEETGCQIDRERYLNAKVDNYKQLVDERGLRVFDGVFDLLDELKKAGVTLAVATSGPREKVDTSLRLTGLDTRFGVVVSGDDVPRGKPAPDVFIEAARRCGVKPETCVGIEDTFPGLKAVRAAGMRVVAVANTFPEQDLLPLCDLLFKRIGDISVAGLLDTNG